MVGAFEFGIEEQRVILRFTYAVLLVLTLAMPVVAFVPTKGARRAFFMLATVSGWGLYLTVARDYQDDRLRLGSLVATFLFACWIVPAVIGLAAIVFRNRRDQAPTLLGSFLFGTTVGLSIPIYLLLGHGIFGHASGTLLAIGLTAFAGFLAWQAFGGWKDLRLAGPLDAYGFTCLAAVASIALCAMLGYVTALKVAKEASMVAAGRPYCLQSDDRTVTSLLDLSVLTFREHNLGVGAGPRYLRNHGLLVIATDNGVETLNWSYRQQRFMRDSLADSPNVSSRPESLCTPQMPTKTTAG